MSHSHRQNVEIQCENCTVRFSAPVWLIVNPRESQGLAQSIARGSLNTLICPNCRRITTVRTPILLYQPDEPPAIVIAMDPGESQDEAQNQAHSLLAYLYTNLSPDEKKKLISNPEVIFPPPIVVPHSDLKGFSDLSGKRPQSTSLKTIMMALRDIPELAPKKDVYALAQRGVELIDRHKNPNEWAWLKGLLSSSTDDVDKGIVYLEEALTVFTKDKFPENWGRGQNDLAHLYLAKTTGDKAQNIEDGPLRAREEESCHIVDCNRAHLTEQKANGYSRELDGCAGSA